MRTYDCKNCYACKEIYVSLELMVFNRGDLYCTEHGQMLESLSGCPKWREKVRIDCTVTRAMADEAIKTVKEMIAYFDDWQQ